MKARMKGVASTGDTVIFEHVMMPSRPVSRPATGKERMKPAVAHGVNRDLDALASKLIADVNRRWLRAQKGLDRPGAPTKRPQKHACVFLHDRAWRVLRQFPFNAHLGFRRRVIGAALGTQTPPWPNRYDRYHPGRGRGGLVVALQRRGRRSRGARLQRRTEIANALAAVERSEIGHVDGCSDHGRARAHLAGLREMVGSAEAMDLAATAIRSVWPPFRKIGRQIGQQLSVVPKERDPLPNGIAAPGSSRHVPGDRPLRHGDPKHQQLAVDPGAR